MNININKLPKPIKKYINSIRHSIIPKPYSHQVNMNILIKKGQQSGTALIPCTIYAMDHSIDLNPALIRKKDKKIVKMYKAGKKVSYDSNNYILELTEHEKKKGYVLRELERCGHCGQKLVISEVEQTRYRSCPSIQVKLGDKAKEDTIVPVSFGVNKGDIKRHYWGSIALFFGCIMVSFALVDIDLFKYIPKNGLGITLPKWIVNGTILGLIWLYLIPRFLYKSYKLHQWYQSVKYQMKRSIYRRY